MKHTANLFFLFFLIISCQSNKQKSDYFLFLGHSSEHHHSERYYPYLHSYVFERGIKMDYTEDLSILEDYQNLSDYKGLIIYANYDSITPLQEKNLLKFVESGGGFVPIHCASACFRNSEEYINLVGGQFLTHKYDSFQTDIVAEHPIVDKLEPFFTKDETYNHHKLQDDIKILMTRDEKGTDEPWTWIREQKKGKIFYTAYGHDENTWMNDHFLELIFKGMCWVGNISENDLNSLPQKKYEPAKIANYEDRDPPPQLQQPFSPEESQLFIQVPKGFEVEIFASEPDIVNPICMAFDDKGRLWVAETVDYPNEVLANKMNGNDRIRICEDTDYDGKADKFTVFAEGLNIPTSICFANGGLIVSQAPEFLFFKDEDGDDVADVRKVLFSGWGVGDTHAGPSNLRYGFDNKIWGTVGYSSFKGEGMYQGLNFGSGVFRMNSDGTGLEFMGKTTNNTWGLGFSEDFEVFGSTANNTHSFHFEIPADYYLRAEGLEVPFTKKIDGHYFMQPNQTNYRQVDVFGGFTAAAGHSFYTDRKFPKNYWNKVAFVCEPTGGVVHNAIINHTNTGFSESNGNNIFASSDEWSSPIVAEVGPDGSLWVIDWYNFIIQHNPTPPGFQNGKGNAHINTLRDKSRSRIYRVKYNSSGPYSQLVLEKGKPKSLLAGLKSTNMGTRLRAQQLIIENNINSLVKELKEILRDQTLEAETQLNNSVVHALWALKGLKYHRDIDTQTIRSLLSHPSGAVRKNAIMALKDLPGVPELLLEHELMFDPDVLVRREAILALMNTEVNPEYLFKLTQDSLIIQNPGLTHATYCLLTKNADAFNLHLWFNNLVDESLVSNAWYQKEYDDSEWEEMILPKNWDDQIGKFTGIVKFRKQVSLNKSQIQAANLNLGTIDENDKVYFNGFFVGQTQNNQWWRNRNYMIGNGILEEGINTIAIEVENLFGSGGINGSADQMVLQIKNIKLPLSGPWKYQLDKKYEGGKKQSLDLISHFLQFNKNQGEQSAVKSDKSNLIILQTIENQMKFSTSLIEIPAGGEIILRFENTDHMAHNLLILEKGALREIGILADKLALKSPGSNQDYIPNSEKILAHTSLVFPGQVEELKFTVPKEKGDYPFVCTFPGHWQIMNGILRVY